jgi:hypothetical protein
MQRKTECLSNITMLKVALSLKKAERVPDFGTAAVISLHYLVLALRKTEKGRPIRREHYVSQALLWKREAMKLLSQAASASLLAGPDLTRKRILPGGVRQQ